MTNDFGIDLDQLEINTGHVQPGQVADQAGLDEAVRAMPGHGASLDPDAPTPCAFITGVAGTGKSFTVRTRCEADPNYAMLAASTGIAAVNLSTVTIHSLLGFFDTDSLRDAYIQGAVQRRLKKIAGEGYQNVAIDECSMIGRETLDLLVRAFDDVNGALVMEGKEPIGLILIGDYCLGKGTTVMRYDGSIGFCEDIRVGDVLMGPDFQPRTVRRTCNGIDRLFKVSQTNGDAYVVNSLHRLALRRGVDGSRADGGKNKNLLRYAYMPSEFPMMVGEFAERSKHFKECFVGYKAGCIPLSERKVSLDPYFLGLWLGDGDKDRAAITTPDPEIKAYWLEFAATAGLDVAIQKYTYTSAVKLTMVNKGSKRENPVIALLRACGVYKNKHIPVDYLLNSTDNRLLLLAGLLDSDGCWNGNRYMISQVDERMARQIKQLGDGLGFRTHINGHFTSTNFGTTFVWDVTIGGDTWRIPCRVARKISRPRSLGRSRLTSVLAVESAGVGEYFGFEVDGDNRFLLGDGTVTYNCQLPPIADRDPREKAIQRGVKGGRRRAEPIPWAFESRFWPRFAANETRLTKIWRQADPQFLAALNFARAGRGREAVGVLQAAGQRFENFVDHDFDGTTLVGKNDEVDRLNQIRLDKVRGRLIALPARRWAAAGRVRPEWKHIPERTLIRENCYVMILSNLYEEGRLVYANGDCGWVRGVQTGVPGVPPLVMVELVRTGETVGVTPLVRAVDWSEKQEWARGGEWSEQGTESDGRYCAEPHYRKKKKRWVTGQVEYYPIRLAYASTTHRSQGLSLDKVQIDFRGWMFKNAAMTYVAMSRARTLQGLRLVGTPQLLQERCVVDPKVARWL